MHPEDAKIVVTYQDRIIGKFPGMDLVIHNTLPKGEAHIVGGEIIKIKDLGSKGD